MPSRTPLRVTGWLLFGLFVFIVYQSLPFWKKIGTGTQQAPTPLPSGAPDFSRFTLPPPPPTLRIGADETEPPPAKEPNPEPAEEKIDATARGTLLLLPEHQLIVDADAGKFLEQANSLRDSGDTPGSLQALRDMEKILPGHPLVLHGFAETYAAMGLEPRAILYWEQLRNLGEKEAGDYASWAEMKLRQEEFTADSMILEDGLFHLGAIRTQSEENFPGGERVTVEIPIGCTGNESVDPSALEVYVFFFEMTDKGKIEQTSSQDIHYQWLGQPTWANGPERLEVIYTRMDGNAEEIRKFYGYIVRIYYRSRLQDVTARPRTLMDYRASSIEWDQPEEPSETFTPGPDPALFPQ